MPKNITVTEMLRLIKKVEPHILTSNNIVPRITCPYFHNHPSVPKALGNFKARLQEYRYISSTRIAAIGRLPLEPNMLPILGDFSIGSFSHVFVGALVVSSFGIGDCGECSARLVIEMLVNGYGDLAFVGIKFPKAKDGMETTHEFIVANLPQDPYRSPSTSIFDFFRTLPRNAVIGDPFLGLAFEPNSIPAEFIRYIDTYGKDTDVIKCFHFCNVGSKFLSHYLSITAQIAKELKFQQSLPDDKSYELDSKVKIKEDTSLIFLLKEKTSLPFFGVVDSDYKVDAITEIENKQDRIIALSLQDSAQGYGRFFQNRDGQRMFVLEGINISGKPLYAGGYLRELFPNNFN